MFRVERETQAHDLHDSRRMNVQKVSLSLLGALAFSLAFVSGLVEVRADHPPIVVAKSNQPDPLVQQVIDNKDIPLTVAEKSGFKATSRFQEVVDFCNQLAKISPLVRQA